MASYAHPWKYSAEDYEARSGGCADCGLSYGGPAWADVLLPDSIWSQISPAPWHGAGLLCFNCINARLAYLGLKNVPFQVVSGPMCFTIRG